MLITYDIQNRTAEIARQVTLKTLSEIEVRVQFSTPSADVDDLKVALGPDQGPPLAWTDSFAPVAGTPGLYSATLDLSDSRLVEYMAGATSGDLALEVYGEVDGRAERLPNVRVTVQQAMVDGPASEGTGPAYYATRAEIEEMIAEAVEGVGSAVESVAGKTGVVVLAKADVGLGNVDNTSDASKPISTATAAALAGKETAGAATTAQAYAVQRANHTGTQLASTISNFSAAALSAINGAEISPSSITTASGEIFSYTGDGGGWRAPAYQTQYGSNQFSQAGLQLGSASVVSFGSSHWLFPDTVLERGAANVARLRGNGSDGACLEAKNLPSLGTPAMGCARFGAKNGKAVAVDADGTETVISAAGGGGSGGSFADPGVAWFSADGSSSGNGSPGNPYGAGDGQTAYTAGFRAFRVGAGVNVGNVAVDASPLTIIGCGETSEVQNITNSVPGAEIKLAVLAAKIAVVVANPATDANGTTITISADPSAYVGYIAAPGYGSPGGSVYSGGAVKLYGSFTTGNVAVDGGGDDNGNFGSVGTIETRGTPSIAATSALSGFVYGGVLIGGTFYPGPSYP